MRHPRLTSCLQGLAALLMLGVGIARAADRLQCHTGGDYFVVGRERTDEAGTDFIVRKIAPGKAPGCIYKQAAGDFVLADKSKPYWFKDLRGDYLILTESTGPTESVVVFDLPSRRKVLDLTASEVNIDDRGMYFWARTAEGTPETCKGFRKLKNDGFMPVVETRARFIFAEARMIEIKTTRCVGAQ